MPKLLHYIYFLASEEEALGDAWRNLLVLYGLKEVDPDPLQHGPDVSRSAFGHGASVILSVADHLAILEIELEGDSAEDLMTARNLGREKLDDQLLDAVGESTFLINPGQDYEAPGEPLPASAAADGTMAVVPEDDVNPRLFLFRGPDNGRITRLIKDRVVALDRLSHELVRQLDYDEEQHQSIIGKIDEMNRKIGTILNERSKELEALEAEVDTISEIHALMTNYNFLLGNMTHLMRTEVSRFDRLHDKAIGTKDPFFHDRILIRSNNFLTAMATTQKELSRSLDNTKSAVDVVKSRVDLNRSRASLDLQHQISSLMKQNVTIQEEMLVTGIAASMVEFFLVVYYGLGVWKMLAGEELVHNIPLAVKGGLIALFSLSVVVGTHKTAKAIKEKTKKDVLLWGLIIVALMGVMAGISVYFAHVH